MKITEYISLQFGNPRGIIGKICCLIMNTINRAMYKQVIAAISKKKGHTILDIGFGNGYLIKKLSVDSTRKIYGIDISNDMLINASKKNAKAIEEGRVDLFIGDCCNLKFNDSTFDSVSSVNTIYFWTDTLKGLTEIHRVLEVGGVFYNVVYSKEWLKKLSYTKQGFKFFEKEDYIKLGKQAGFSNVVVQEIVNGKSYIIKFIK